MAGFNMNIFRILADLSHTASKCILIWAIHSNKSAEGVSLLTQLLYALVFGCRYLDLFWVPPFWSKWNTVLKIFYIGSSAYIVWLMMRVYARTREREYAWKLATWSLAGALVSSPLVCLIFNKPSGTSFGEILWTFSIELESVCVLPQLLLLRQTSVPTVIDSFYLVTLGSYRFFYILNWIVKGITGDAPDPISVIFGVVQTALYVDFAWVYWTRQRIKLRGGAVVDQEDLSKSFIVNRIIGRGNQSSNDGDEDVADEDERLARQERGTTNFAGLDGGRSWGARGISVSADDTLNEHARTGGSARDGGAPYVDDAQAQDARMIDPSHFEDDDDDTDDPPPPVAKDGRSTPSETAFTPSASGTTSPQPDEEVPDSSVTAWASNDGSSKRQS